MANFGIPQGWAQMKMPPKMDGSPDAPNGGVGNVYVGPSQSIGLNAPPPLLIGLDMGGVVESPTAPPPPQMQQKVSVDSFVQNLKTDEAEKALELLQKKVTYLKAQKIIIKKLNENEFISNPVKDTVLLVLGFNTQHISYVEIPFNEIMSAQSDPKYVTNINSTTLVDFERILTEYYLDLQENLIMPILATANVVLGRDLEILNTLEGDFEVEGEADEG